MKRRVSEILKHIRMADLGRTSNGRANVEKAAVSQAYGTAARIDGIMKARGRVR